MPGFALAGEMNRIGDSAGYRSIDPPRPFCVVVAFAPAWAKLTEQGANAVQYYGGIRSARGAVSGAPAFVFVPPDGNPTANNTVRLTKDNDPSLPAAIIYLGTASDPGRFPLTTLNVYGNTRGIRVYQRLTQADRGTSYEGKITATPLACP
jgi:hypothetical protein